MTYPSQVKTILIGKESTWGTAVTTNKDIGLVTDINDDLSRTVTETQGLGAIESQVINSGLVEVGVSATLNFQHGRILEYIFGTVAHTTTSSDEKHTFTIADNPPSFTLESSENSTSDVVLKHEGMIIESCDITASLNDILKIKFTAKGQSTTSSTSATAATISTLPTFEHALTTITIDGAQATEVQEFNINVAKEVNMSGGLASNIAVQAHATSLKIGFSAKLGFTDDTFQKLFLGGTGGATTPSSSADPGGFTIIMDNTNGVSLGSGLRQLKITLDNAILSKFTKSATVGNLIFVDIEGVALLNECFSVDNIASGSW